MCSDRARRSCKTAAEAALSPQRGSALKKEWRNVTADPTQLFRLRKLGILHLFQHIMTALRGEIWESQGTLHLHKWSDFLTVEYTVM